MKEDFKDELTYKVIGCAMKIHRVLGGGLHESVYQRALSIEFRNSFIQFVSDPVLPIYYESEEIGVRKIDFVIEDAVMIQLKVIISLEEVHMLQGLNHLVALGIDKGLILNFGAQNLEVKRVRQLKNKLSAETSLSKRPADERVRRYLNLNTAE
jgi:GxxExxY protein